MSEQLKPIRTVGKRGKDKQPRKNRTDSSIQTTVSDDTKRKIMIHNMQLMKLGKMSDPNNLSELCDRIEKYMTLCIDNDVCPTVASFALALGVDRSTLWNWINERNGAIKNPAVLDTLKNVYSSIAAQYEALLTENKIVPVSAIFLMKNNHGYKDQTDHIITARQDQQETEENLIDRAGLLTD